MEQRRCTVHYQAYFYSPSSVTVLNDTINWYIGWLDNGLHLEPVRTGENRGYAEA